MRSSHADAYAVLVIVPYSGSSEISRGSSGSRERLARSVNNSWSGRATESRQSHRGSGDSMHDREIDRNTGSPRDEEIQSH